MEKEYLACPEEDGVYLWLKIAKIGDGLSYSLMRVCFR